MPGFKVRERVKTSGRGRTADWKREYTGVVERVTRGSVFVQWDGLAVTDEMKPFELASLGEFAASVTSPVGEMLATTETLNHLAQKVKKK